MGEAGGWVSRFSLAFGGLSRVMKKHLKETTSPKQQKMLSAKELARVMGKPRHNRALGVKGGQQLVKRQ